MGGDIDGEFDGGDDDCDGPHRQCQACSGQRVEIRETLYLAASGQAQGVAAPHVCWHCAGHGFYCVAAFRCVTPVAG
ncbi:hypothetical protein FH609_014320 [Streptomyces sp. 3MP-14]|uniref:Uncharacterized protein n=1 Tax=Streptomyces mimosae TaxID=2586635 RepID=A0A5N5ZWS9_9ACTN|nr:MULTISPECIES: hypothetical protein [Streptomyces]KAB8160186.1 hypothetical protein FH607_027790 [Streptomyces mimosae]KAB8176645.1 hypothetical protein FH609_014320 [Streptomyces sp. 3MP-14]